MVNTGAVQLSPSRPLTLPRVAWFFRFLLALLVASSVLKSSEAVSEASGFHSSDNNVDTDTGRSSASDVAEVKRSDDVTPVEVLVQQQAAVIQRMQADLDVLKNDVTALKTGAAHAAAFSVHFHDDPIRDVGVGATLRFDAVTYNVGSCYNPLTGIFTAPTAGVYVFFINVMGDDTGPPMYIGVFKSGQLLDSAWVEGKTDTYDQGSCLVSTHLTSGEQVWAGHAAGATSFRGSVYTTFSGFLVHADI